jgi:hypothetical protein
MEMGRRRVREGPRVMSGLSVRERAGTSAAHLFTNSGSHCLSCRRISLLPGDRGKSRTHGSWLLAQWGGDIATTKPVWEGN